ncbi:ATP-binding protein, partial [Streptomyces sp. NPDC056294]|uniref:ATP-binding protein n=1 Tax=Streptomyces sp. NPDC056294 TaxID=3345773 RepID=UPI0035D94FCE
MSLSLTRRIARAALIVAAGAAPVVGAAGSASALDHGLAPTGALGGLSALDVSDTGDTVDGASRSTAGVVGQAGEAAAPVAQKVAGDAAGTTAGQVVGKTAGAAAESAEGPNSSSPGGGTANLPTDHKPGGPPPDGRP